MARWTAMAAAAVLMAAPLTISSAAHAAQADPAAAQIEGFDSALIDVMKGAKTLGIQGRYHKLEPIVARSFDIPTMIRFAVGASWTTIPAAQQTQLTEAFNRLTVASFAHNFSGYSGEHFQITGTQTRGVDKVVTTQLIATGQAPVVIAYRMRQVGGTWKIIDVFYNGAISQLTTRHADFQASLAKGGAPALVAHLNALVDKELK